MPRKGSQSHSKCLHLVGAKDGCQGRGAQPPQQDVGQAPESAQRQPRGPGGLLHHPDLHAWVSPSLLPCSSLAGVMTLCCFFVSNGSAHGCSDLCELLLLRPPQDKDEGHRHLKHAAKMSTRTCWKCIPTYLNLSCNGLYRMCTEDRRGSHPWTTKAPAHRRLTWPSAQTPEELCAMKEACTYLITVGGIWTLWTGTIIVTTRGSRMAFNGFLISVWINVYISILSTDN